MKKQSVLNAAIVEFAEAAAKIVDDPDLASYRILQAANLTQVKILEQPVARVKRVSTDLVDDPAASSEREVRPYNPVHYRNHKAAVGFERMLGLLDRNFDVDSCFFYTLTYEGAQQSDYDIAVRDRTKLLRRLRDAFPGVKYVSAFGRHKSGGIHLHLVADTEILLRLSKVTETKKKKGRPAKCPCWESFWPHGYVHTKKITQAPIGGPLASYLKSNGMEIDLSGKHMFVASKNISGFIELKGGERNQRLQELIESGLEPFKSHVVENVPFAKKIYIFDFRSDMGMLSEARSEPAVFKGGIINELRPLNSVGAIASASNPVYVEAKCKKSNEIKVG